MPLYFISVTIKQSSFFLVLRTEESLWVIYFCFDLGLFFSVLLYWAVCKKKAECVLFWIHSGPSQCLYVHSHGPGAKHKTRWLLQGEVQWHSSFFLSLLSASPYLCSGAVCEGRGVKGKPALRVLSPMARQMSCDNARFETGSWASLELQWLPLVRVGRPV